jgi:hypothetical protein|tara:strand:- start:10602 stop:10769 length:168 start_codon:yes stop_codon:yes gene_type:complete
MFMTMSTQRVATARIKHGGNDPVQENLEPTFIDIHHKTHLEDSLRSRMRLCVVLA